MIRRLLAGWAALVGLAMSGWLGAQTCTTQAKMSAGQRDGLAQSALALASAIQGANVPTVRADTMASLAGNFGATEALVREVAPRLAGDTMRVTQLYLLDASHRAPGDAASAEFSCQLAGTADLETDFSISGLPQGVFAFAMVEAEHGAHPWLLAMLLEQEGGGWKLAGLYPRARTAAGHDGLWYWTEARARVKAGQPWSGWLDYAEAGALLRPAPFVSSTHLDSLRSEQHDAAPPGLAEGVSAEAPLVLRGRDGGDFRITSLAPDATEGDGPLRLLMHVQGQGSTDPAVVRARGEAAARALVAAHPELRSAFTSVLVFVDSTGANPEVVSVPMSAIG